MKHLLSFVLAFMLGFSLFAQAPGTGVFFTLTADGDIRTQRMHSDLNTSWSLIVPGNFTGTPFTDFFCYDRNGGRNGRGYGAFFSNDGNGNLTLLREYDNMDPTWTIILAGNFNGRGYDDLFFYSPHLGPNGRGLGQIYTNDGTGEITHLKSMRNLNPEWTVILPGNFNNDPYTDFFFYDPYGGRGGTGLAQFYTNDGAGNLNRLANHNGLPNDWTMILPGQFDGDAFTDIFVYGPNPDREGRFRGEFFSSQGNGEMNSLAVMENLNPAWDIIAPGNFNGDQYTDLLFYGTELGRDGRALGQIYSNDGDGGLTRLRSFNNWHPHWGYIVPGTYNGDSFTDLFFYDKFVPGPDYLFPVHFAVITNRAEATERATMAQLKEEVKILNRYFLTEEGDNPVYFVFAGASLWEDIGHLDYELLRMSSDGLHHTTGEWARAINAVDNPLIVHQRAINFFVYDNCTRTGDYSNVNSRGRPNGDRPMVMLDWARLDHRISSPEEHEMGHAFGLGHVCNPTATNTTPTNIMATPFEYWNEEGESVDCPGDEGLRNLGFTEEQLSTILQKAALFKAAFAARRVSRAGS